MKDIVSRFINRKRAGIFELSVYLFKALVLLKDLYAS